MQFRKMSPSAHLQYIVLLTNVRLFAALGDQIASHELRLYDAIVNEDSRLRQLRPVRYANESVHVTMSLALIGLDDVDEKRQVMTSYIWLRQSWKNPYVSWNPDNYGGLRSLMIPTDQIWIPDITALNSVSDGHDQKRGSQCTVYNDGLIVWTIQTRLDTFCYMDMTYFPLDQHNCSIVYGSWNYDMTKLNLSIGKDSGLGLRPGSARENGQWSIQTSSLALQSSRRGSDGYPELTAYFTLSRRHAYVIQRHVTPVVTFILLTPAVFMLPAESAHKFLLGSGLLISEILLLTSLDDVIPTAHHTPPRLGLYYVCAAVLVACSLGISALVANIWNRSKRRSFGVPSCVRVVLLKGLGRLVCLYYEDFLCVDSSPDHIFDQYTTTSLDTISQGSSNHPLDDAKMIREYNSHVVHRAEWRQLAAIVDRTFCLVFWMITIVFIVAMAIKL